MSIVLPDDFRIERQPPDAAPVLVNLMEHYLYDMAEWFGFDSAADGAYHYDAGNCWDGDRAVYFACTGDIPIGFALVWPSEWAEAPAGARDVKEFFVMRRHRHAGVADRLAGHIWDEYPGPWVVRVFAGNRPAVPFWRRIVAEYSGGAFVEQTVHDHDKDWIYLGFTAPERR